jgi:hypothetical protein
MKHLFLARTFACVLACTMLPSLLSAQSSFPDEPIIFANRLSIGTGYGTVMGSIGYPIWTAAYTRGFAKGFEVEVSVYTGANSRFRSDDLTHTIVSPNYNHMIFWNLTNFDATLLWTPSGTQHGFRIGLGGTVQYNEFGSTQTYQGSIGRNPPDSILRVYPPSIYSYGTSWILGTHVKLDYILPLSGVVDAGIRAQGYVMFWRLAPVTNVQVFSSGTATINAFIGVRF